MPKSRLEAFSDCIIAFAVTLLIYDFHLQNLDADMDNARMLRALLALAPHFSVYVISFLVCTVWWMGHHMFIHDLAQVDSRLLFLNCLFLMWIAILPFPTALLEHHPSQPVVIVLYGIVCTMACVFFTVMRWYASFRGRLMRNDISEQVLRRDLRISSCFPFFYVAAATLGFFYPAAGLFCYAAIPAVFSAIRLVKRGEGGALPAGA
jgi:uncharacterized membrane protein